MPEVVRLRAADHGAWRSLRQQLWPDSDAEDATRWLCRDDVVTLLLHDDSGAAIGFVEAGERSYADGCETSPVAYLEGWYVARPYRNQGLGRLLVNAVEHWAQARGLSELASDTLQENADGIVAHEKAGFTEVERAVRFRKALNEALTQAREGIDKWT